MAMISRIEAAGTSPRIVCRPLGSAVNGRRTAEISAEPDVPRLDIEPVVASGSRSDRGHLPEPDAPAHEVQSPDQSGPGRDGQVFVEQAEVRAQRIVEGRLQTGSKQPAQPLGPGIGLEVQVERLEEIGQCADGSHAEIDRLVEALGELVA